MQRYDAAFAAQCEGAAGHLFTPNLLGDSGALQLLPEPCVAAIILLCFFSPHLKKNVFGAIPHHLLHWVGVLLLHLLLYGLHNDNFVHDPLDCGVCVFFLRAPQMPSQLVTFFF